MEWNVAVRRLEDAMSMPVPQVHAALPTLDDATAMALAQFAGAKRIGAS